MAERWLVLLLPDWPTIAAAVELDADPSQPLAVLDRGRIRTVNAPGRSGGVRAGQLRRRARLLLPELLLAEEDPARDARAFEPVLRVLEERAATFTVLHPGLVGLPMMPLAAFAGSEEAAVEQLITAVTDQTGHEVQVGVADALFTGLVAARAQSRVPAGCDAGFLAVRSAAELICPEHPSWADRGELVERLEQLGIRRLGELAALPAARVLGRFGPLGALAHRQAAGLPEPGWRPHRRDPEFSAETVLEPPALRADQLGFAGRSAADRMLAAVAAAGLRCAQVQLAAEREDGAEHVRVWRLEPGGGAKEIADRLRWHVEGWISAEAQGKGEPCGILRVRVSAVELIEPLADQPSLLARRGEEARVGRSLSRLQGMFGVESVLVPGLQGGRLSEEENLWIPWQQAGQAERDPQDPWPGRIPAPHPLHLLARPAALLDASGADLQVSLRHGLLGVPHRLHFTEPGGRAERHEVVAWSESWPVETGWWDPDAARRLARVQVLLADGRGFLLHRESGGWQLAGGYD